MNSRFLLTVLFCVLFSSAVFGMDSSGTVDGEGERKNLLSRVSARFSPQFSSSLTMVSLRRAAVVIRDNVDGEDLLSRYKAACERVRLESLNTSQDTVDHNELFKRGMACMVSNNYTEAIRYLRRAAEQLPLAYIALAECCFTGGKNQEGFSFLEKAKTFRDLHSLALAMAVKTHFYLMNYEEALKNARELAAAGDDYGSSYEGIILVIRPAASEADRKNGWRRLMESSKELSSQFFLGYCFRFGIGTPCSISTTLDWYRLVLKTPIDTGRYGGLFPAYEGDCLYFKSEAGKFLAGRR